MSRQTLSRRELLAGSAAVGATLLLPGGLSFAADGKKTFTTCTPTTCTLILSGWPLSSTTPQTNSMTTRPEAGSAVWPH